MEKIKYALIFRLSVFVQICIGAHAWFFWEIENGLASQISVVVFALIALLYKSSNSISLRSTPYTTTIVALFCLAYICTFKLSIGFFIGLFFRVIPVIVLISDPWCRDTFKWIVKAFTYLLIPGIILHILLIIVPSIPGYPIVYHDSLISVFYNYIFILKPMYAYNEASMMRFYSVFLEPGYLGTLVAFLLFASKFNLKSIEGKTLLIAELLSFSLAGYVTLIIAFIIYKYSQRAPITRYIIYFVGFLCIYWGTTMYNGGDNTVNHLIVQRLQSDEDKGFVGNNRTGEAADYYFDQVMTSSRMFFGLGADEVDRINGTGNEVDKTNKINGAGYKIFIVTHGIIATIMFFIFYLVCAARLCPNNKRYSYGFVFLVAITFIQAAYPDSNSWIFPFLYGIMTENSEEYQV